MSIEANIVNYTEKLLKEQYIGRHLTYSTTKEFYNPWKIHEVGVLEGTHVVVDVGFYFSSHNCPSDDPYSYAPGIPTYECYLTVQAKSSGNKNLIHYNLGDL